MIRKISIHNFKSLKDVEHPLGSITCLIGLNGSGKSTILQAIGFVQAMMVGRDGHRLEEHGWTSDSIRPNVPCGRNAGRSSPRGVSCRDRG